MVLYEVMSGDSENLWEYGLFFKTHIYSISEKSHLFVGPLTFIIQSLPGMLASRLCSDPIKIAFKAFAYSLFTNDVQWILENFFTTNCCSRMSFRQSCKTVALVLLEKTENHCIKLVNWL